MVPNLVIFNDSFAVPHHDHMHLVIDPALELNPVWHDLRYFNNAIYFSPADPGLPHANGWKSEISLLMKYRSCIDI